MIAEESGTGLKKYQNLKVTKDGLNAEQSQQSQIKQSLYR